MRLWPRSLYGRLLAIAFVSTAAALLFAGFAIGHVLERVVMRGLDERLDAQIMLVAGAVRPDGTLDPVRVVDLPAFARGGSGWAWRADGPGGRRWTSGRDADALRLSALPPPPPDRRRRGRDRDGFRPGEDLGPRGGRVHFRRLDVATPAGPVTIVASGPRRVIDAPLREAMTPLLGSLALLGGALAASTLLQLRLGLRPLGALRAEVAAVRAGRRRRVTPEQPAELAPLAAELNALIDQNEAGLAHARRHVANLAHGLKTPLAALGLRLAEPGRDPDGGLGAMVAQIDRRVRHHLGRARAAAPGGTRAATPLAAAVDDLVAVLARLHADRAIEATMAVAAEARVAVDREDLDEMVGNLLDNAWRHARRRVRIAGAAAGPTATIAIEDDGPGLDDAALAEAMLPGRRLDERGDGHGFGLPIAQELAELNGGGLTLARSAALGGLAATLTLPAAG